MQLSPREIYPINRIIENHTDTATYYVRAVIRNVATNTIIKVNGNDYVNLTDLGNRRFSVNWLVPADVSGQGFYISITTSTYTDSGYTTKSENYGDRMETLLIQDRFNRSVGLGGGIDIDYKKIRKIVNEVVAERLKEDVEMPEMPKVIEVIKEKVIVPEVNIPAYPSFEPILKAINATKKAIDDKEIPEQKETDLTPVIDLLNQTTEKLDKQVSNSGSDVIKELTAKMEEHLNKNTSRFNKIEQMKKMFEEVLAENSNDIVSDQKKKEPVLDPRITRLMQN